MASGEGAHEAAQQGVGRRASQGGAGSTGSSALGRQDHHGPIGDWSPGPRQAAHLEEDGGTRKWGGAPPVTQGAISPPSPLWLHSNPLPWCQQPCFQTLRPLTALLGSSLLEGAPGSGPGSTRPLPSSQTTQLHSVPSIPPPSCFSASALSSAHNERQSPQLPGGHHISSTGRCSLSLASLGTPGRSLTPLFPLSSQGTGPPGWSLQGSPHPCTQQRCSPHSLGPQSRLRPR